MEHPAVARWKARFAEDACAALSDALGGRTSLGPYDQLQPADALSQILSESDLSRADENLCIWLSTIIGLPTPKDTSAKRFSENLIESFRLIALLRLPLSRGWCAQRHGQLRIWLRGFYFGRSRDPEAALLVALAQQQTDRSLLVLWNAITRKGRPVEHVRHALTGLRLMPANDQGAVERSVPPQLLRGLVEFGEALSKERQPSSIEWLQEIDYLTAVYPMSKDQWSRRFNQIVESREISPIVKNWLEQRFPDALRTGGPKAAHLLRLPPHVDELKVLLDQLPGHMEEIRPHLKQVIAEHRRYCRESGDTYYLVRTFCFAGERLLQVDPAWARELAHEAAIWEPHNDYTWALLGKALEQEGDWRRAEAVLWHARRRFPENPVSHTQLGHALLVHGHADLGEAVYREAIQLFPGNPVCWGDLGHTLRVTGKLDEAVAVYKEAQEFFHRNVVIANAIADILVALGRLDEAEDAIAWAEKIVAKDDARNQQILARIRERLERARTGKQNVPQKLKSRPERSGGDIAALADITGVDFSSAPTLGRASLLRRKANGGLVSAQTLAESLPEGSDKLIELGLLRAAINGWPNAARWFEDVWKHYEGDGVLRVHRQRARSRAGENVDWSFERTQYPELISVVLTEERGQPPSVKFLEERSELTGEQRQDLWFSNLVSKTNKAIVDRAEEDYLAARHQL